jgi:hypothetical protein
MNSIALLSIVHDKQGKLVTHIPTIKSVLDSLDISEFYIDVTEETDPSMITRLESLATLTVSKKQGLSQARRNVLGNALENSKKDHFLFVDFDRLIFWICNFLNGFKLALRETEKYPFLIMGRSTSALWSHPTMQRRTESICNDIFALQTGRNYDILAGARGIRRDVGRFLLESSVVQGAGADIEWPLLVLERWDVGYIQTNGLGFESAFLGIRRKEGDETELRCSNIEDIVSAALLLKRREEDIQVPK